MKLTQWINQPQIAYKVALTLTLLTPFLITPAAWAHHPFGGQTPETFIEALLSGIGHPVIGLDHLTFVIASGLVAMTLPRGIMVPIAFLGAALLGTGFHLMAINLPLAEMVIMSSVFLFGLMLVLYKPEHSLIPVFENTMVVASLAAMAGIFHGYAYGEAIIGAEMGPLFAYLTGFTLIQGVIAMSAYGLGKQLSLSFPALMRYCGLAICTIGVVLLSPVM